MGLGNNTAKIQTKTKTVTAGLALMGRINAIEGFGKVRQVLRINALTKIPNCYYHFIFCFNAPRLLAVEYQRYCVVQHFPEDYLASA